MIMIRNLHPGSNHVQGSRAAKYGGANHGNRSSSDLVTFAACRGATRPLPASVFALPSCAYVILVGDNRAFVLSVRLMSVYVPCVTVPSKQNA